MTDKTLLSSKSFTLKYTGKANQLITDCGVCKAFDPSTHSGELPVLLRYKALWDTGATGTVITKRVADQLGIMPTGLTMSYNANGQTTVNTYLVNLVLPNNVLFSTIEATEGILNGFDVLIGMNVIQHGDFSITCRNGNTIFSFQLPSTRELDFVNEHRIEMIKAGIENNPCTPPLDKRNRAPRKRKKRK